MYCNDVEPSEAQGEQHAVPLGLAALFIRGDSLLSQQKPFDRHNHLLIE